MGHPGSASTTSKHARSLSYRMTALLKPLLPAAIATLLLSLLYYSLLLQQYEQFRHSIQQQQQQTLALGQDLLSADIRRIASAVAQLVATNGLPDGQATARDSVFLQAWNKLIKTHQPAAVALYHPDGSAIAQWPDSNIERKLQQFNNFWIQQLTQSGQTQQAIFCQSGGCVQYRFSYLPNGQTGNAILSVARSVTPLLKRMQNQNSLTGMLTAALDPAASTDLLVFKWGYQLNTGQPHSLLQQALKKQAQSDHEISTATATQDIKLAQRFYQLTTFPLLASNQSLLVKLDDTTDQVSSMRLNALQMALLILLLSGSATLLYLKRIHKFGNNQPDSTGNSDNLPKNKPIIQAQYPEKTPRKSEKTSAAQHDNPALTQQVEQLRQYNEEINHELAHQMVLLSKERDRANKILDHSQAIIMILLQDGSIKSINAYGEKITGFSNAELEGKNFIDLYPHSNPAALKDLETISAVTKGMKAHYQHEAYINRKDGEECIIQWTHTRFECDNSSDPLLLSTGQDITSHRKLEKSLRWLVNHDSLTTLFNRRRFEKEMDAALQWAKKSKGDGILITIDLENFKDINDACGHKVGDIILRKVANSLQTLTQPIDHSAHKVTARLGGDEFAIILRNINNEGGCNLSRRIIKALNRISHFQHQISFQLSASIGIATFSDASHNTTELLSNANYARNQAKIDGRNRYQVFNPQNSHLKQTHHRMIWRDRIENALRNNRFVLHFQPILDISHNRISHYETLIRMLDENNELIAPGLFIHIAEQYGLIQQIDSYIIASAIAKQGELVRQGHDLTLTINLSAKAFDDEKLYHKISQAIRENNANAQNLVFEITETGAVSNIEAAQKIMTQIQALGCKFALDDFGVGFSSFHYLRKLPVDLVKIDGSFVTELNKNADNKVLIKALSEVAMGFNKLTVAEFVDSKQTLEILRNASVNYAQGFFIGKPSATIPVALPTELMAAPSQRLH